MRLIICLTAAAALCACQKQAEGPNAVDNNMTADANATAPATPAALTTLNETSWEYTDPKTKKLITESIDANGKYLSNAGTEHFDHGTATMKDGKACFTSAMTKDGETCWSDPMVGVGQSGETTSDKGEKLTVKRIAYTPLTM